MKPSTPLPWRAANWTSHAPITVLVDDATSILGKHAVAECLDVGDAAYIAHTANAYPALVAIARKHEREIWERSSEVVDGVRTVCADERGDDWRAIVALLRQLGEIA